jgi:hypothetical protein
MMSFIATLVCALSMALSLSVHAGAYLSPGSSSPTASIGPGAGNADGSS